MPDGEPERFRADPGEERAGQCQHHQHGQPQPGPVATRPAADRCRAWRRVPLCRHRGRHCGRDRRCGRVRPVARHHRRGCGWRGSGCRLGSTGLRWSRRDLGRRCAGRIGLAGGLDAWHRGGWRVGGRGLRRQRWSVGRTRRQDLCWRGDRDTDRRLSLRWRAFHLRRPSERPTAGLAVYRRLGTGPHDAVQGRGIGRGPDDGAVRRAGTDDRMVRDLPARGRGVAVLRGADDGVTRWLVLRGGLPVGVRRGLLRCGCRRTNVEAEFAKPRVGEFRLRQWPLRRVSGLLARSYRRVLGLPSDLWTTTGCRTGIVAGPPFAVGWPWTPPGTGVGVFRSCHA